MKNTDLIWIDLEMTGLEPEKDVIIEIATIVTSSQLVTLAEGPSLVIHQSDSILDTMNEWCVKQHGISGLTQEVRNSTISLEQAETLTLSFLEQFFGKRQGVLCGNSVWQDRAFIKKYMPRLHEFMHYRIIDVSSVKEVLYRWYPESPYLEFKKKDTHRALIDIRESIEELKHYKTHFFPPIEQPLVNLTDVE